MAMCRVAFVVAASMLVASVATAKGWNGLTPGVSTKDEVISKFGEPSKTVTDNGKEKLGYLGERAIKGTTQVQIAIGAKGIVEEIVVFPATQIDRSTVEETFGPPCSASGGAVANCYVKKLTDEYRTYFWYKRLGFVVFLTEDGKSVYSFIYNQPASGEKNPG